MHRGEVVRGRPDPQRVRAPSHAYTRALLDSARGAISISAGSTRSSFAHLLRGARLLLPAILPYEKTKSCAPGSGLWHSKQAVSLAFAFHLLGRRESLIFPSPCGSSRRIRALSPCGFSITV